MPWSTLQGRSAERCDGAEVLSEFRELGDGWELRECFRDDAAGAGCGDVDPGVAVALGDGEGVGEDLCGLEGVVGGERGDLFAAAGAGLEAPAVVFALDGFAVEPAGGEWDAAVWAEIAEGEERVVAFAADEERDVEEGCGLRLAEGRRCGARGTSRCR